MKVLLDIRDNKAAFVMELLQNLPFVKARKISAVKAKAIENLAEAVHDVKLAKEGKIKLKNLDQLLNEI